MYKERTQTLKTGLRLKLIQKRFRISPQIKIR